jgi:hypothetical protein
VAEPEEPGFRGKGRNQWFGLESRPDFEKFRKWWHREGKDAAGGRDLASRQEAEDAYNDWADLGKPEVH